MMRGLVSFVFALVLGGAASASPLTSEQKRLFLSFAQAVSEGDADITAKARRMTEQPPTTLEEIGFYGLETAPGPSRALRGIISALDNADHLMNLEPSYVLLDFEGLLYQSGAFSADHRVPDLLSGMTTSGEWDEETRKKDAQALAQAISAFSYAAEAEFAAQGMVVMDVTLMSDDVVYFWITTPEIAANWQCVLLLDEADLLNPLVRRQIVVQPIDWADIYDMTLWSVGLDPAIYRLPVDLPDNNCPTS